MANKKTNTQDKKKTTKAKNTTSKNTTKKNTTKKVEVKEVEVKKEVTKKKDNSEWLKKNYMLICALVIAILLIVNVVLITLGHQVKLADGKEVIASVEGKDFVAEDLFNSLKESYGETKLLELVDSYIVDQELTDEEKLAAKQEAQTNIDGIRSQYEQYGYKWEDVLANYGYNSEEDLLNEFTLAASKEAVAKKYIKANLTDEEIKEYYDANVFGKYTAKHILIIPETNDSMTDEEKTNAENAAKAKAQEVINRLNNGEDFNSLVAEYSQDTGSKDNQGLVENFTKGEVADEFWDAVSNLNDNEYTKEPVKSSYGYHVILKVNSTEKEALDKIKDSLVDKIIDERLSEDSNLYNKTWVKIRTDYNFTINDTTIKNDYEKSISE